MSTTQETHALRELRPAGNAYRAAFVGLLGRDLYLLRKSWKTFLLRTLIQPLLLVFVFAYVFPKTGQGVGGSAGAARFSTQLVAGVMGLAIVFQGIQAVALPLVGMRFGFRTMLVAHVALLSAYVVLVVGARAAGADRAMEEAALDLGANRWQMLRDVVLPDLRPAIVSSGLLAAAFSFDDVALSASLRGPRDTTLPVYLFSVVQRRVTPAIYAVGTMVVVGGAVMFAAAMVANRALHRPDLSR